MVFCNDKWRPDAKGCRKLDSVPSVIVLDIKMKLSACQNDCVLDFESIANKKGQLCLYILPFYTATLTDFAVYIVTFILMKTLIVL